MQPPNAFGPWLYELRERGMIVFDDRDAASVRSSNARFPTSAVYLLRVSASPQPDQPN